MNTRKLLLIVLSITLLSALCSAQNFSFSGTFTKLNQIQNFTFTVGSNSSVVIQSSGYAAGGFDPVVALFQGTGSTAAMYDTNDDEFSCIHVTKDPVTLQCNDSYLESKASLWATNTFVGGLAPGTYTVTLSNYGNSAVGPTLGNGFTGAGGTLDCSGGARSVVEGTFLDCGGFTRTGNWALNINGVQTASLASGLPSITVSAPNGGEAWTIGSTHAIQWTSANLTGNVNITLVEGSNDVLPIASGIPASAGSFSWVLPATLSPAADYTVRVASATDATVFDVSNAPFTVSPVPAPSVVSVTPNSGTGNSQVFNVSYSDPGGFGAIALTQTIISSVRSYTAGCAVLFTASTNSIQMKDDSGQNWSAAAKLGVAGTLQNSQCSIDVGASSAVGSGNNLTLSLAVTFQPAYLGTKNIYSYANEKTGVNSGWQTLGTWIVPSVPPSAVSVAPSSGSGASQVFQFTFSDPSGFAAINLTQTIIGSVRSYTGSCTLMYTASTGSIQMKDDSGQNWSAAAKLGIAGVLQNSQCSVDAGASSAVGTGKNLSLNYAVTFKPSYGGAKNSYALAYDKAGLNSGWQTLGTWTVPLLPPSVVSVAPNSGTGSSQVFQVLYSDPAGFKAIALTQTIISSVRSYVAGCAVLYTASTNSIQMKDDSGQNWSAAANLGVAGVLQNSQCSIDAGASSTVGSGTSLTLNLAVAFKPTYVGTKNIYSFATEKAGANSGWQTLGTWIP